MNTAELSSPPYTSTRGKTHSPTLVPRPSAKKKTPTENKDVLDKRKLLARSTHTQRPTKRTLTLLIYARQKWTAPGKQWQKSLQNTIKPAQWYVWSPADLLAALLPPAKYKHITIRANNKLCSNLTFTNHCHHSQQQSVAAVQFSCSSLHRDNCETRLI